MKMRDIAEVLNGRLVGDGAMEVERPVHPAEATAVTDLAIAMQRDARAALEGSVARAAVVAESGEEGLATLDAYIVIGRARYAMAGLMDAFERPLQVSPGIHETAVIADGAVVAEAGSIGPFVYVGPNARLGAGTVLAAQVTIGAEATIGENCLFHPGVRVGERVLIGDRAIIQHNASIGADGVT